MNCLKRRSYRYCSTVIFSLLFIGNFVTAKEKATFRRHRWIGNDNFKKLHPFTGTNNKIGFNDERGNVVIHPFFDKVGSLIQSKKGKEFYQYILFYSRKRFPINITYEPWYPSSDERYFIMGSNYRGNNYRDNVVFTVMIDEKWYIMLIWKGRVVSQMSIIGHFPEGLIPICTGDYKYGYIDPYDEWVIPPVYQMAQQFSEGLALVMLDEEGNHSDTKHFFGYINTKGEMVIPLRDYETALPFREGRACVGMRLPEPLKRGGSRYFFGYIDKKGKVVIDPRYERAENFHRGIARVLYQEYTLYNCLMPVNNCLGFIGILLSGRIGGSAVFQVDTPDKFGIINRSGRLIYSTEVGWGPVDNYIKKHYQGWFGPNGKE